MYCAKCGKQIPDNAVFCDNCGADQRQKAAVQNSPTLKEQKSRRNSAKSYPERRKPSYRSVSL